MSGDVQPRKRKDKKRKKDELSVEEHRGTAAVFGEGDVLMHSQHEHGTGGHWCAKIIFFSLLAVLVTLIGLIILENRGLTELEANAVESRYSGVLDGWIEEAPDDDHHDEHTLELKHHEHTDDDDEHASENDLDNNGDEHDEEIDHDEDDDDDEEGHDEEGEDADDDENDDGDEDESKEIDQEEDEDEDQQANDADQADDDDDDDDDEEDDEGSEEQDIKVEAKHDANDDDDDNDDDDKDDDDDQDENDEDDNNRIDTNEEDDDSNELKDIDDDDDDDDDNEEEIDNRSVENDNADDDDDENSKEDNDEDDDEHEEEHEEEIEEEIEKIEKEVLDQEEPESVEVALPETSVEKQEDTSVELVNPDEEEGADDSEFLVVDDLDEPAVERIAPPPSGKPYDEIEDEVSTEVAPNTLAEEEEYEKQQEQLRQEEEQSSSHMWLRLAVGGALLAATHAVVRRATGPRDAPESEQEEHASREETPLSDRRMTLISEEAAKAIPLQSSQPKIDEEIVQKTASFVKAAPVQKQESEEIEEDAEVDEEAEDQKIQKTKDDTKELYSDEDENEADEEVDEEEELEEKEEIPKLVQKVSAVKKQEEPEDVEEDVEIIDDEQVEEEVDEEVEDEEEISDVDDAELLTRLEAKYGRLPEPERPGQKHKDGGNSVEDDWPGEPSEVFWREQLDKAEQDLRQGAFGACEERTSAPELAGSGRALYLRARALDARAEAQRDNRVLAQAISAYLQLLKMNEGISDKKLVVVALRTIDRIKFRGTYLNAEPVYRLLIRRFPNDVTHRNNLTISFLMANRADLASEVLRETLRLWPNDRVALAHYGFILKTEHNKLEEAVTYFKRALEGDAGAANEPRFYYHLGDALLMLGRKDEADAVHRRGAELGHFLSPLQRSLYNVERLQSQPWWDVAGTPYARLARELEAAWRDILREGEAARALYEREREGLRERGEWSQLDVFVRGREVPGRCERAPVTCAIVRREPAARCRRGQVKFSALSGGTHVRAHVGPTNCRLRLHLALSNTQGAYLRVGHETRQWEVGKVLMFDDSFEHEVWHNGTATRLVLIVDVWHPALSPAERRDLPAI
ncbi:uncharacterized protein Asph isoform X2 [Epargyreus clarus]|uniref:uncharacterized protein Asph isoform X2 n=1 Tax=Epargyreus clarus TaxID=520877 RepID=UPI003C2C5ECA